MLNVTFTKLECNKYLGQTKISPVEHFCFYTVQSVNRVPNNLFVSTTVVSYNWNAASFTYRDMKNGAKSVKYCATQMAQKCILGLFTHCIVYTVYCIYYTGCKLCGIVRDPSAMTISNPAPETWDRLFGAHTCMLHLAYTRTCVCYMYASHVYATPHPNIGVLIAIVGGTLTDQWAALCKF